VGWITRLGKRAAELASVKVTLRAPSATLTATARVSLSGISAYETDLLS
jgi:hypothetical protein